MTIAELVAPQVHVPHYRDAISQLSDDEALDLVAICRGNHPETIAESLVTKELAVVEHGEASLTFIGGHVATILSGSMSYLD